MTFADSDWAGDADRRSNSGTATWVRGKLGWYPVSAASRKRTTVALSSGEAEMVAALSGACEGLGLHELWQRLIDFKSIVVNDKDQVESKNFELRNTA